MKIFKGDCVHNPFETSDKLIEIIDRAREIKKHTFFKHCLIEAQIVAEMYKFPNDFRFFKSAGGIYFYQWSAIEHFYL